MKRVKVIIKPPMHGSGKDSPSCTCRGRTGELQTVHTDGIAIVRFDKSGGRAGIPFSCLREI